MRTTIEIPDALFRKTKAAAALRGSSLKDLIVHAIERAIETPEGKETAPAGRVEFPLIRSRFKRKLDLSGFDFDDLLA